MNGSRFLIVTADDFGIGPMTSRGILDLAVHGRVSCAVLLVNSPHAESAVEAWRRLGMPMELGWHPCLTLDRPLREPATVPSLVDSSGRFLPLKGFLKRLALRQIHSLELRREIQAQYRRYLDLAGGPPAIVNAHHHVHAFPVVGREVVGALSQAGHRPYVRRVREPIRSLVRVPGSRLKRAFLTIVGGRESARLDGLKYDGNDCLAGITDNRLINKPEFVSRWLANVPGRVVEWICHPGEYDCELEGRDGSIADGGLARRVDEFRLLASDGFPDDVARAGFVIASPSRLAGLLDAKGCHAA